MPGAGVKEKRGRTHRGGCLASHREDSTAGFRTSVWVGMGPVCALVVLAHRTRRGGVLARPVRRAVRSWAASMVEAMAARSWRSGTRGMSQSPSSDGGGGGGVSGSSVSAVGG